MAEPPTLVILLILLLAALPGFGTAPIVAAAGVKNAAGYADPSWPNGSIAQGSVPTGLNLFDVGYSEEYSKTVPFQ